MNYLDIALIIPVIYGFVQGFSRGIVKEITSLVSLIIGIYIAVNFSLYLESHLEDFFRDNKELIPIISFALVFAATIIAIKIFVAAKTSANEIIGINSLLSLKKSSRWDSR